LSAATAVLEMAMDETNATPTAAAMGLVIMVLSVIVKNLQGFVLNGPRP
jgi:hypothetical protein